VRKVITVLERGVSHPKKKTGIAPIRLEVSQEKGKKAANTPLSCTLTKLKQGLTHELKKACAKHELN
jgi:hypothetical protein